VEWARVYECFQDHLDSERFAGTQKTVETCT